MARSDEKFKFCYPQVGLREGFDLYGLRLPTGAEARRLFTEMSSSRAFQ
jgi:hypothetical protein